jgi:hypothetical protein
MIDCKDCRHYLVATDHSGARWQHYFARCASPRMRMMYADICRDLPGACGPDAHFFEPLPLGRSHGVDWDRARKIAAATNALKAIVSSEKMTIADILDALVSHSPVRGGVYRDSLRIYADGVEVDEAQNFAPSFSPYASKTEIGRFTAAEYLEALTTDYCRADAAE